MSQYKTQWVIYLDADLYNTAYALANKPGNSTQSFLSYSGDNNSRPANGLVNGPVEAPIRLIIVGHGDERSTSIGNLSLTPSTLAECIAIWVGGIKIARVSLHMCCGGGNRGTATNANFPKFKVHPNASFGYKLASYCGQLTTDVTARTESVVAIFNSGHITTAENYGHRKISPDGVPERKAGAGDKIFFITDPASTLKRPIDPSFQFFP